MKPRVKTMPARTRKTSNPPNHKILVAVDFSDGSRAALRYAAQLASPFNAAVTVLNVVEVNNGWLKIGANEFPVLDEQLRESTRLRLADFTRENGGARSWRRWIDTSLESPHDIVPVRTAPLLVGQTYQAAARSVVVLYGETGDG